MVLHSLCSVLLEYFTAWGFDNALEDVLREKEGKVPDIVSCFLNNFKKFINVKQQECQLPDKVHNNKKENRLGFFFLNDSKFLLFYCYFYSK